MGLDMYLNKRHFFGKYSGGLVESLVSPYKDIKPERIKYIDEEIAYWRKANQIHHWFVQNVQDGNDDCGNYECSIDQLKALCVCCETVLANRADAAKILPAQSGFFFGGTDYDEYYFADLEHTLQMLKEEIDAAPENTRSWYVYHSSW